MDKLAGDRRSVDRATWQRRTLEDEAADELEPLQGAAGERWWLGGADRGRVHCRAAVAASSWLVGGVATGWLACSGERESVWRGSTVSGKTRGATRQFRMCGYSCRALGAPSARPPTAR